MKSIRFSKNKKKKRKIRIAITLSVFILLIVSIGVFVFNKIFQRDYDADISKKRVNIDEYISGINALRYDLMNNDYISQKLIDSIIYNAELKKSSMKFDPIVKKTDAVDDDYFNDAVFIGNSRTEGFIMSNGLSNVNALASKGLMVDTVFNKQVIKMDGRRLTVSEALKKSSFDKVYIMLGMNELGWVYSEKYIEKYENIIDCIREVDSDAVIYVQSILPVSQKKSQNDKIYNNDNINNYNKLLIKMCARKQTYYVNVREDIENQDGCLPQDAALDGVHLNKVYCVKWYDYLKTHTVSKKTNTDIEIQG